jgi:hypothetical protein
MESGHPFEIITIKFFAINDALIQITEWQFIFDKTGV